MDVIGRIRAARASLRPAEQRVATAVLADPAGAVAATVSSLAERAEVSQATVVRFARALGFDGLPDLRIALTQDLARLDLELERSSIAHGRIDPSDDLADVVAKLAFHEARSIEQTGRLIDHDGLGVLADAVASGRPVVAFGVGASGLAATDLTQKLQRIGLVSVFSADTHLQLVHAALATPDAVAIAFSYGGRTAEVHRALTIAKQRGALTVAVTGSPMSPVAEVADIVLLTAARESEMRAGALSSRMAQLAVVDFLFVLVAQRLGGAVEEMLERTRHAVQTQRLL